MSPSALQAQLDEGVDWVIVGPRGEATDQIVPEDPAPATLVVAPVSDALKHLTEDDLIDRPLDRESMWEVQALVFGRALASRLAESEQVSQSLFEAAGALGVEWEVRTGLESGPG